MIPPAVSELFRDALKIWQSGGWGMIALAIDAVVIFSLGTLILFNLWSKGLRSSADRAWRRWREAPERARGTLARMIREAMARPSLESMENYFESVYVDELAPFERDLKAMMVSVSAAPLLGLLGTVTGMLTTFHALATGGGGDKTMGMIASGISEALITTETGLVLALAGMMYQYYLSRQQGRYQQMIAHLETLCTQHWQRGHAGAAARPGKEGDTP